VWRDGACERTIQAHTEEVMAVAVLPGGARFVSSSADGTAKLWTLDGALERTIEVGSFVLCFAALPDGVHFVVDLGEGRNKGEVRLYRVDGTLVHTFKGHTNWAGAVVVTPDGQHIISGSGDTLVKVWSVASMSLVSTCEGHTGSVYAVAAMPDGQRILSGSRDSEVRVWLLNGTLLNTFKLHIYQVTALVALPDNQHALSGSYGGTVQLFNVNNGAVLRTFDHDTGAVLSLAPLPDGLRFVSGSSDGTARIAYHGLAP
jgi:WD40 repeat protein